jgi:hypothetical protein
MNKMKQLWAEAKRIRQQNGLKDLLKTGIMFLISLIYSNKLWYLYEYEIKIEKDQDVLEAQHRLKTYDLNFVVVSSNEEADKLEMEGFGFRSYPTTWNIPLNLYTHLLDLGAIAFCTFVGKDLAVITWVIPSQQVQEKFGAPPLKLDYHHEAFIRGAWVNPEYRGLGLYRYTARNRDRFLLKRGITTVRTAVTYRNEAGRGLGEAIGHKKYGTARLVTILLWWKSWRETLDRDRTTP